MLIVAFTSAPSFGRSWGLGPLQVSLGPSAFTRCRPVGHRAPIRRAVHGIRRWDVRAELNLYEVLGVPKDADETAIKKAYRRAALRSHPDVSKAPDAEERFRNIQMAYATLSNRSKRDSYDRRSRAGTAGFADFGDFASAAAGSGFGNAADFAKRWREKNPMPDDLNDSLGSIFSDLFSGVSDVVDRKSASPSIFEDFVEFLEDQVGGFTGGSRQSSGYDSDGSSEDEGLEEILANGSIDVLATELEDTTFLLSQLRAREAKLREDAESVQARASEWASRARRSDTQLDYDSRRASSERESELREAGQRLRARQKKVARHISAQAKRESRITAVLEERKRAESAAPRSAANAGRDKDSQRREVDEELERLKRELGLQ
jgi:curved DNA-binding protein CbpA